MPSYRWRSAITGRFTRPPRGLIARLLAWFTVRERVTVRKVGNLTVVDRK